jgi:putative ABC transport system permease protein
MIGAPLITYFDLIGAALLLLLAAGLSLALSLGLGRDLVIGGLRAFVQLTLLGMALKWIFAISNPWAVGIFIFVMLAAATRIATSRVKEPPAGLFFRSLLALAIPGVAVTAAVTAGVIGAEPWYEPRFVLPIAGMVIGNTMNAVAVSLDRLFSDLRGDRERIVALLALGARPREAIGEALSTALRAGLIPTLNAMSAAGIVFIPGMMTGQILSGVDPALASRYQLVVLAMICAATAMGSTLAVLAGYRKAFDSEERFILEEPNKENTSGGSAKRAFKRS